MTGATPLGKWADRKTATRPRHQSANSAASFQPTMGNRPVQFGTAVNKKPARIALKYPNKNACACQDIGSNRDGMLKAPESTKIQMIMDSAAHNDPNKKKGRNPKLKSAGPFQARICSAVDCATISDLYLF